MTIKHLFDALGKYNLRSAIFQVVKRSYFDYWPERHGPPGKAMHKYSLNQSLHVMESMTGTSQSWKQMKN